MYRRKTHFELESVKQHSDAMTDYYGNPARSLLLADTASAFSRHHFCIVMTATEQDIIYLSYV